MKIWSVGLVWLCMMGGAYAVASSSALVAAPTIDETLVQKNAQEQGAEKRVVWDLPDKDVDLQCLKESYPAHVAGMEDDAQGTWLVMHDGRRVLYAVPPDVRPAPLSPEATVRQSMAQPYPLEPARPAPGVDEHPGRVRSQALLAALYGGNKATVRSQLRIVSLAGRSVLFSSTTGADEALRRVSTALKELLQREPKLREWVLPLGGTFLWRRVAGEERLSAHSFGVAVDLSPSKGAYWRWSGGTSHPSQAIYPSEIVKLFEDNGFVWGGKWREFDLMHFEYRPEILCKSRKLQGSVAREM